MASSTITGLSELTGTSIADGDALAVADVSASTTLKIVMSSLRDGYLKTGLRNNTATTAPGVGDDGDDGYTVGSAWFDVTNDKAYFCLDASTGSAVWVEAGGGGTSDSARSYKTTDTTLTTATWTTISMTTEDYDNGGMIDIGTNASRITIQTAGVYRVGAAVRWAANATGVRNARIQLNGTTVIFQHNQNNAGGSNAAGFTMGGEYNFSASDYIELQVYQNSGGNLALTGTTTNSTAPYFWASQV